MQARDQTGRQSRRGGVYAGEFHRSQRTRTNGTSGTRWRDAIASQPPQTTSCTANATTNHNHKRDGRGGCRESPVGTTGLLFLLAQQAGLRAEEFHLAP